MPIIRKPILPENKYGNYFLAKEAPGDENNTPRNVRVVSVPQNNRNKDFTTGYDDNDDLVDDNDQQDTEPQEPSPEEPVDDNMDFTTGADGGDGTDPNATQQDTPPADTTGTDAGDGGETTDFTAGADGGDTGDMTGDETGVDDGGMDDTTDFTAGADGGDGTDPNADPNAAPTDTTTDTTTQNNGNAPGTDQDATRKYKLYSEYISLYNSLENYISKLEKLVKDDRNANKIINYCTKTFRSLRELLYDYVTIKFVQNNYVQDLLFYEKLVAVTQITLKMLRNIRSSDKSRKR